MDQVRETLEARQVAIYFAAIVVGGLAGMAIGGAEALEAAINPALALMLFVTFLQVPLVELGAALKNGRFLAALLAVNFVAVPLLAYALVQVLPDDPMLRLGVLMVLLTPCIDYVVTFAHLGRGDARLLLASTPILLIAQMLLLPIQLGVMLGDAASGLVQPGPFVHAFVWLIALPLLLAAAVQFWAGRSRAGASASKALGLLPVPATALVLVLVLAAVAPRIGEALPAAMAAAPVYVAFAVLAPLLGLGAARLFSLEAAAGRAVSFSAATRNSLVVLPLAFAVPGGAPLLPAVIVTQTIVELVSELVYIRLVPRLHPDRRVVAA